MKLLDIPQSNSFAFTTYTESSYQNLQIDVHLATPAARYDPVTLDGLLAYSVIQQHMNGQNVRASAEPYYIPLPLEKLWACPETRAPLWNATHFFPMEDNQPLTAYWHKRGFRPERIAPARTGKPYNANFGQGTHKEYRIPLPLHTCKHYRAYCNGDFTRIAELLKPITSIGKKRTQGFGRVLSWQLTPIERFTYFHENRYIKAFPIGYPNLPAPPLGTAFSRYITAWTPPYWLETLFQECVL